MISKNMNSTVPSILSNASQKAYEKIKSLILKIFALFKKEKDEKNLKEEFYNSYIDFARKLDNEGYSEESNHYMNICAMYYDLMDRPKDLIAHEDFFIDLFNSFDEILLLKINQSDDFEDKYNKFIIYNGKMQQYYYTHLAIPSEYYDEHTCKEIIGKISGGLK